MRTVEEVRGRFPALEAGFAFMDNAGGSQVPGEVIEAMGAYLRESYVQVGADYPASVRATETVARARAFATRMVGAGTGSGQRAAGSGCFGSGREPDGWDAGHEVGETFLGASTTSLLHLLAHAYANAMPAESEVVVATSGHEANVGPWMRLAERGFTVRAWEPDEEGHATAEGLTRLLSERTRIVAFPLVSNLLGVVEDFLACVALARAAGARTVVDAVAYAPHAPMEAAGWGVDWLAFSAYKTFGPHLAALWGRAEARAEVDGPNHFFLPRGLGPYSFELGGVSHEACAGLLGTERYLAWLAGEDPPGPDTPQRAMQVVAALEAPLTERLVGYLRQEPRVRLLGGDGRHRFPTVSFVPHRRGTKEVVDRVAEAGIGMRWGHFYSYRLCQSLGLDPETGVCRVSLAHTNTMEEVDRVIGALKRAL